MATTIMQECLPYMAAEVTFFESPSHNLNNQLVRGMNKFLLEDKENIDPNQINSGPKLSTKLMQ